MAMHEHQWFVEAARLRADHLTLHSMMSGPPSASSLAKYDAIFFGGSGAFSVLDDTPWIRTSIETLLRVVDARVPAYASCFGFQGLAIALDGEVIHDEEHTEMGSTEVFLTEAGAQDSLFAKLPPRFWVQEGHHDRVSRVPKAVEMIVGGDFCFEQAFRVRGAPFWASQFHPELTVQKTIDRFHHYADYYLDPAEVQTELAKLESGLETREVSDLLARVAYGEF